MTTENANEAEQSNNTEMNTLADVLPSRDTDTQATPTLHMDEDDGAKDLTTSEILELLAVERRRVALKVIAERGSTDIRTIADDVAAQLGDPSDRNWRKTIYISLYQTHLPRLARDDILEKVGTDTYVFGPNAEEVMKMLARIEDDPDFTGTVESLFD